MAWVKLDDRFFRNPKIIDAGRDARDLYLAALCYCASELTDGFVPGSSLRLLAAEAEIRAVAAAARRLAGAALWVACEGGYRIPDYLDYNPSREEVLAKREGLSEKRAEAGRRGAAKRWQSDGKTDSNPDGKSDGKPMAKRWQTDGPRPLPLSPSPTPSKLNPTQGDQSASKPRVPARARFSPANPFLSDEQYAAAAGRGLARDEAERAVGIWARRRREKGTASDDWVLNFVNFLDGYVEKLPGHGPPGTNGHAPSASLAPVIVPEDELTPLERAWREASEEERAMGQRAFTARFNAQHRDGGE